MKPEADPPQCPDCGERVYNDEEATMTPLGVYHSDCDVPNPDEI